MKKYFSLLLSLILCLSLSMPLSASDSVEEAYTKAAAYVYTTCPSPTVSSTGGEWAVLGLARGNAAVPEGYFGGYYRNAETRIAAVSGVLHKRKYTEYARVGLALTAIGKNPERAAGYNLLLPLADYEKTLWQGINGPIFALLCLDAGGYSLPVNTEAEAQADRTLYRNAILDAQNPDGGWSLSGDVSDADLTAMALSSLAPYRSEAAVSSAIDTALSALSVMQTESGGFISGGVENTESTAQVMIALCTLGIPCTDARFVKNGKSPLDALLSCQKENGGFSHTADGEAALMPTEQALCALAALRRFTGGQPAFYDMRDINVKESETPSGLSAKHPDVICPPITSPGKTFSDLATHPCRQPIEGLAERGIINGKSELVFDPEASVTRAEFAAITVRALGLSSENNVSFSDVTTGDWFLSPVSAAAHYGLVKGISESLFAPHGTVTRQEAAVITARAAALCGMQTDYSLPAARDVLSVFSDYSEAPDWAMSGLAFCIDSGILPDSGLTLRPTAFATRAEVGEMLYNLLAKARLI